MPVNKSEWNQLFFVSKNIKSPGRYSQTESSNYGDSDRGVSLYVLNVDNTTKMEHSINLNVLYFIQQRYR